MGNCAPDYEDRARRAAVLYAAPPTLLAATVFGVYGAFRWGWLFAFGWFALGEWLIVATVVKTTHVVIRR